MRTANKSGRMKSLLMALPLVAATGCASLKARYETPENMKSTWVPADSVPVECGRKIAYVGCLPFILVNEVLGGTTGLYPLDDTPIYFADPQHQNRVGTGETKRAIEQNIPGIILYSTH